MRYLMNMLLMSLREMKWQHPWTMLIIFLEKIITYKCIIQSPGKNDLLLLSDE